jgi:hypothetical protein
MKKQTKFTKLVDTINKLIELEVPFEISETTDEFETDQDMVKIKLYKLSTHITDIYVNSQKIIIPTIHKQSIQTTANIHQLEGFLMAYVM